MHNYAFGVSLRVNLFFLVIFVFGKCWGVLRGIASESHLNLFKDLFPTTVGIIVDVSAEGLSKWLPLEFLTLQTH